MNSIKNMPDFCRVKEISRFIIGKEILNLGGSEGYMQEYIKNKNPDKIVYTHDFSGQDFNFDLNGKWPIKKKFNTIIAGEVIEHLDNARLFLLECMNHLLPDGRLILTTPNATGLNYIMNPEWCVNYKEYEGHCHAFTLPMLEKLLRQSGFSVIHKDYINAFWKRNPLKIISHIFKRLRPDIIIVGEIKNE